MDQTINLGMNNFQNVNNNINQINNANRFNNLMLNQYNQNNPIMAQMTNNNQVKPLLSQMNTFEPNNSMMNQMTNYNNDNPLLNQMSTFNQSNPMLNQMTNYNNDNPLLNQMNTMLNQMNIILDQMNSYVQSNPMINMDINFMNQKMNEINEKMNQINEKMKQINEINQEKRKKEMIQNINLNMNHNELINSIIQFYKENNNDYMNFDNPNQIKNMIYFLSLNYHKLDISDNIEDPLYYIEEPKKIINFRNSDYKQYKVNIPLTITKYELYSIVQKYKCFKNNDLADENHSNILLIHNNLILNRDETSIECINENDVVIVVEPRNFPDDSYYKSLQERNKKKEIYALYFPRDGE